VQTPPNAPPFTQDRLLHPQRSTCGLRKQPIADLRSTLTVSRAPTAIVSPGPWPT